MKGIGSNRRLVIEPDKTIRHCLYVNKPLLNGSNPMESLRFHYRMKAVHRNNLPQMMREFENSPVRMD